MSRAEQIVATKKTIAECDAWIASYDKIIAEGNEATAPFNLARRDSWIGMRAESVKTLAKLEAM